MSTVRRVAMLSVHTSPLEQPGSGDAGGLNVYLVEIATRLARRGVQVEIFTRTTSGMVPRELSLTPGVLVRHVTAGPFEGLVKEELPAQLCAFAAGVMRAMALKPEGYYDVVHSHYWLSGQVGWLVADRWQLPLVHTMHTMARVKNAHLAAGDFAEPSVRDLGEEQVVQTADALVANTATEADELIELYGAQPNRVAVVHPGVDLDTFVPGDQQAARRAVGLRADALVLTFVGRLQPLKAPDLLLRAAAELIRRQPELRERLVLAVLGGASGAAVQPSSLRNLAHQLGIGELLVLQEPVAREGLAKWLCASDLVVMPSYSESFGLVALEATACGTPVVAAQVGGLPLAVGEGGVLVSHHDPVKWAQVLGELINDPARRQQLSERARRHAMHFGWERTTSQLVEVYQSVIAQRAADPGSQLPLLGDRVSA